MNPERMPVLIGAGQITDKRLPEEAGTPIELMAKAARQAACDSGADNALLRAIDTLVAVGLTVDSSESSSFASGMYRNLPMTVSNKLGIQPARQIYTDTGGNTPQKIVNRFAEQIAQGECQAVLLTGAEALNTMIARVKQGLDLNDWQDDPGGEPQRLEEGRGPVTAHERLYGMRTPSVTYPLFENALRGKYGLGLDEHKQKLGELYHRFNKVAAANPLSWFPTARSAEEITQPTESNRYVGFPYTKYLNSIIQVNMGAAVIMTSVAKARELGVADEKMVYLHGCGDACDALGIAHDDPRGLTVTGGLPYFGGPGNNYVMHSIATMMDKLRADPGSFGLLNGNGWYVTKHSLGIYSTTPLNKPWRREDPQSYQAQVLDQQQPPFTETPQGAATVETYTVVHNREGLERGLVIGRLADGTRFLAETPDDPATLQAMMDQEMLGAAGTVSTVEGKNLFVFTSEPRT